MAAIMYLARRAVGLVPLHGNKDLGNKGVQILKTTYNCEITQDGDRSDIERQPFPEERRCKNERDKSKTGQGIGN